MMAAAMEASMIRFLKNKYFCQHNENTISEDEPEPVAMTAESLV
jgi:hypothetical protein